MPGFMLIRDVYISKMPQEIPQRNKHPCALFTHSHTTLITA
ncbi:hypothetical protein CsSME_00016153 [Camellia sinensis var. sinensis]